MFLTVKHFKLITWARFSGTGRPHEGGPIDAVGPPAIPSLWSRGWTWLAFRLNRTASMARSRSFSLLDSRDSRLGKTMLRDGPPPRLDSYRSSLCSLDESETPSSPMLSVSNMFRTAGIVGSSFRERRWLPLPMVQPDRVPGPSCMLLTSWNERRMSNEDILNKIKDYSKSKKFKAAQINDTKILQKYISCDVFLKTAL